MPDLHHCMASNFLQVDGALSSSEQSISSENAVCAQALDALQLHPTLHLPPLSLETEGDISFA
jgi:hypothetical protein